MKAVICMAGEGKRLRPLTNDIPKGMIRIGNKTILEYLLDNLSAVGLKDVIIVIGYKGDQVKKKIGTRYKDCHIKYVNNPDYAITDNSYSLWLARNLIPDGMIFFNGDIVVHENILRRALQSKHTNALVVDDSGDLKDDAMKVHLDAGKLREIGKKILSQPNGWAIGIYRLSKNGTNRYFEILDDFFRDGPNSLSFVVPIELIAKKITIYALSTRGEPWKEIDTHGDYTQACREICAIHP